MTSKPWMPWHIAAFVADTTHLDAAETGAYMLLLGHYWLNGGKLPEGDAAMARIGRMTPSQWKRSRETLLKFFPDGRNKRADHEMARAAEVSETNSTKARDAANRRWLKRRQDEAQASSEQCSRDAPSNARSKPQAMLQNAQSQSHTSEPNGSGAKAPPSDPKAEYFRRGREVLGPSAGGVLSKLLKSQGNEDDPRSIAKARAHVENASAKAKPAEWIGRILAGPQQQLTADGQLWPEGIT